MSNINKFLNVPSLEVYIRRANFLTIQQAKKKNVDIRVLNKLQNRNIRCIAWNFLESLLSANRIGLNVKNDHEIGSVYNEKKRGCHPWGNQEGGDNFFYLLFFVSTQSPNFNLTVAPV